jgi:predicted short-subunit dehydrogenase-like oxidoreductase (DUF2520 family)
MTIRKISLIGSGRVATQLGIHFRETNKTIVQVYSRTFDAARQLARLTGAEPVDDLEKLSADTDLYLIAVVDDAIETIAKNLKTHGKPVVHTSGSVSMDVLRNSGPRYGVFYPLQTFSKTKDISFKQIPICIEGACMETEILLKELAEELSGDVRIISSGQRVLIHIAAVFANNFTNFNYMISQEILEKAGVSFDILLPLIDETTNKIHHSPPCLTQTGPAARGDDNVISKHLNMLLDQPEKRDIYQHLSQYILTHFSNQQKK